jgi:hypothetical protein
LDPGSGIPIRHQCRVTLRLFNPVPTEELRLVQGGIGCEEERVGIMRVLG